MTGTTLDTAALGVRVGPDGRSLRGAAVIAGHVLLVVIVLTVLVGTWRQWTVIAFPMDAGREMIIPRLLMEGKNLYSDIRCFYGPVGYWLNAVLVHLLGGRLDALWWVDVSRFLATCGLLWLLARRLLGAPWAGLVVGASLLPLFRSFLVPYTAGVGWGGFFLLAGLVIVGRRENPVGTSAGARPGQADRADAAAAAACLAVAAACKHEYALAATLVWAACVLDACRRGRPSGEIGGWILGAAVPLGIIAAKVLATAPWRTVLFDNLWLSELWAYHRSDRGYHPLACFTASRVAAMLELTGLLMAAVAGVQWFGLCRRPPSCPAAARSWWWWSGVALVGVILVSGGEALWQARGGCIGGLAACPQQRLRALIELAPVLVVPGIVVLLAGAALATRRSGPAGQRLHTDGRFRLGILCALACLPFCLRELPVTIELNRQPLAMLMLVWLLLAALPAVVRWDPLQTKLWQSAVGLFLLVSTIVGLDNLAYLQSRPGTRLYGPAGSMAVIQRRQPYTPEYFRSGFQIVLDHQERIAGRRLACVPEGAWINALMGMSWPTRDTQWMPFTQRWVLEDLQSVPPEFILQLEPLDNQPQVAAFVQANYRPVATSAFGAVLHQRVGGGAEPAVRRESPVPPGKQRFLPSGTTENIEDMESEGLPDTRGGYGRPPGSPPGNAPRGHPFMVKEHRS